MKIFITGTDTNVGKTHASLICTHALQATYWKPIQSGLEEGKDSDFIQKWTSCPLEKSCYEFKAPMSPHHAAFKENQEISMEKLLQSVPSASPLIIEGAGGLMVPLHPQYLLIDFIEQLKIPCILVTRTGLGTLNHTLLSLEALQKRKIKTLGLILCGDSHPENEESLVFYGKVPIITRLPFMKDMDSLTFKNTLEKHAFDVKIFFENIIKDV